jgi:hypothetical protein
VQLGDTVIGVGGGTAPTALMPRGAPPTEAQPAPQGRGPPGTATTGASPGPAPARTTTHEPGNLPALAALFLGPLSILLVFLSAGGFFLALPGGIAAIVLGTIGIRNAGRQRGHHPWRASAASPASSAPSSPPRPDRLHRRCRRPRHAESSVGGLIDRIRDEIDKVDVPEVNTPDVNAPDVNTQEAPR